MIESGHITIITDDAVRHEFPDSFTVNTPKTLQVVDRKTAKIIKRFNKRKVLWEIHH